MLRLDKAVRESTWRSSNAIEPHLLCMFTEIRQARPAKAHMVYCPSKQANRFSMRWERRLKVAVESKFFPSPHNLRSSCDTGYYRDENRRKMSNFKSGIRTTQVFNLATFGRTWLSCSRSLKPSRTLRYFLSLYFLRMKVARCSAEAALNSSSSGGRLAAQKLLAFLLPTSRNSWGIKRQKRGGKHRWELFCSNPGRIWHQPGPEWEHNLLDLLIQMKTWCINQI